MRIIGQCGRNDFAEIEHLADVTENPEMLDVSTLNSRQKFAFIFLTTAFRSGISWDLVRTAVKDVLFWGEGDDVVKRITIKFVQNLDNRESVERFRRLWTV